VWATELSFAQGREGDTGSSDCSSVSGATHSSDTGPSSLAPCVWGHPATPDPYHDHDYDQGSHSQFDPTLCQALSTAPEASSAPSPEDKSAVTWAEVVRQVLIRGGRIGLPGCTRAASDVPELRQGPGERGACEEEEAPLVGAADKAWAMVGGKGERDSDEDGADRGAGACLGGLLAESTRRGMRRRRRRRRRRRGRGRRRNNEAASTQLQ